MGDVTMDTNNSGRNASNDYCPCIQTCLDEMNGTYQDMKKTFNQVFYAFVVSGDDIDRVVSLKCVYHSSSYVSFHSHTCYLTSYTTPE